jgi:hypothetical protein
MSAYQVITERLISLIESGSTSKWTRPWNPITPRNAVSGANYRGANRVLLSFAQFEDPRWLTYKQATQLGGFVNRGERGMPVLFYKFGTKEEVECGKPKVVCKQFTVFNLEQTTGVELPEWGQSAICEDALVAAQLLLDLFTHRPVVAHGGDRAYYSLTQDKVVLPPVKAFTSSEKYFSVLAHELSHSTMHESRLNRRFSAESKFGSKAYSMEEIVAQLSASFLCQEFGIEGCLELDGSYIKSWLQPLRNDPTFIIKASGYAQKSADWIMNRRQAAEMKDLEEVAA